MSTREELEAEASMESARLAYQNKNRLDPHDESSNAFREDDGILRCVCCGKPLEDNMYTDDPEAPCLSCMQGRADLLHDQIRDMDIP